MDFTFLTLSVPPSEGLTQRPVNWALQSGTPGSELSCILPFIPQNSRQAL